MERGASAQLCGPMGCGSPAGDPMHFRGTVGYRATSVRFKGRSCVGVGPSGKAPQKGGVRVAFVGRVDVSSRDEGGGCPAVPACKRRDGSFRVAPRERQF